MTLAEQYIPGNVRSASGGDTRLIRFAHGEEEWYSRLAWRARTLWLDLEAETGDAALRSARDRLVRERHGDFED